jgi:hypothetical protein
MHRWSGTGRYTYPKYQAPFLGSAASRSQIIENLLDAGLLSHSLPDGWMGLVQEDHSPPKTRGAPSISACREATPRRRRPNWVEGDSAGHVVPISL